MTRYTFRGTRQGPLRGIPATERPVALTVITIQGRVGDRIAARWAEYDKPGPLQRSGVIPP